MKLFIKALVTGTAAALLFFIGTGISLAGNGGKGGGGSGGSRGGSSRGSSQSGVKMSQGSPQTFNKTGQSININKTGQSNNVNKMNTNQHQTNKIGSTQLGKNNLNVARNHVNNSFKSGHQNYKSQQFCGTWNKGCYPSCWNYGWNSCGFGFGHGCWNSCSFGFGHGCWNYYPWFSRCYTPCYDYCCYPEYNYCCTTPVFYTCQPVEIVTNRVIQTVQQAPVVETVTTTQTTQATETSAALVKPPVQDTSFLTSSALRR